MLRLVKFQQFFYRMILLLLGTLPYNNSRRRRSSRSRQRRWGGWRNRGRNTGRRVRARRTKTKRQPGWLHNYGEYLHIYQPRVHVTRAFIRFRVLLLQQAAN